MARTTPGNEDDGQARRDDSKGEQPFEGELEVISKSRGVYCFAKKVRRPGDAGDSSSTDIGDDQSSNRHNDTSIQRSDAEAQRRRAIAF